MSELTTAKAALQSSLWSPHNNLVRCVLCPHFIKEKPAAVKAGVAQLQGGRHRVPRFWYTLHSMVLVFTAQILTEVNRGSK